MKLETGIQHYLDRITDSTRDIPAPVTREEKRDYIEKRHAVWWRETPDHIRVRDWWIGLPGREIPIRMYRRSDVQNPPIILYIHGGGFTNSSFHTHNAITWGLADETGALVVSVNYRRAPENPFPAAPYDCFEVLKWIERNGDWLQADPSRLAIAGDSAGGTLTAALAILSRDRGGPVPRLQCILYGSMDTKFDRPSLVADKDPMLTRAQSIQFWTDYLQGDLKTNDPVAVPMRVKRMEELPPALVVVGQYDPLRDACEEYAGRLHAAGVPCEFREVPGAIHGFYRARFVSDLARAEFSYLTSHIRAALS